jgi:hypothetical protein
MGPDHFKPLEIGDRPVFERFFQQDPPEISELTFTNLFMWRHKHGPLWMEGKDCLLIILRGNGATPFGLQPVGPGDKAGALDRLCKALGEFTTRVQIRRVGETFVENCVDPERYQCTFDPDNSDYVFLRDDLMRLSGRKYHRKKNQVNRFVKNNDFQYRQMDMELVECFLDMQENWCRIRDCTADDALMTEDYAIREALTHFGELKYTGGAIQIESRLEAISIGESLNDHTAVIHIEKANPEIPGLYAAMNQFFCREAWSQMRYINREQDLGLEGLRRAKQSYHPHHMVRKYVVTPRQAG